MTERWLVLHTILYLNCVKSEYFTTYSVLKVHSQLILIQTELKFINIEDISTRSLVYVLKLQKFRTNFYFIYEMLEKMNEIFGWSQVAAILFCFYLILSESNWAYIHFPVDSPARKISKYKNNFLSK